MLVGEGFSLASSSDLLDKIGLKQDDISKIITAGQTIKTTYDALKKPASTPTLAPTSSYTPPPGGIPTWAIVGGIGLAAVVAAYFLLRK